jgi:hypothetical protein
MAVTLLRGFFLSNNGYRKGHVKQGSLMGERVSTVGFENGKKRVSKNESIFREAMAVDITATSC